jgi:CRP-like cAMP-binding protein
MRAITEDIMNRRTGTTPLAQMLGTVGLFSGLSKRTLNLIASMCHDHTFEPGDEIVTEGDASGRFYVIAEGGAEVRRNGHVVNTLGPGQYFGEYAVLDRAPRSATVVATTPVRAYSLASITLRPLLKEEPDLTYRLLLNACERIRAFEARGS